MWGFHKQAGSGSRLLKWMDKITEIVKGTEKSFLCFSFLFQGSEGMAVTQDFGLDY